MRSRKAGQGAGLGSLPGADGKRPPGRQERAHGRAPGPGTDQSMIDAGDIQTRARWAIEKKAGTIKEERRGIEAIADARGGLPESMDDRCGRNPNKSAQGHRKKAGTIKEELHKNDEASFSKLSNKGEKGNRPR